MAGFSLLLVDDDEDDFFIISQAFEELGQHYELKHVSDGRALIDRLASIVSEGQRIPDLVLLDINMPRMNGLQTLEQIRGNKYYGNIPVFMYSTSVNAEEKQQCLAMGANAVFTKAYTYKKVLSLAANVDQFLNYPYRMPAK